MTGNKDKELAEAAKTLAEALDNLRDTLVQLGEAALHEANQQAGRALRAVLPEARTTADTAAKALQALGGQGAVPLRHAQVKTAAFAITYSNLQALDDVPYDVIEDAIEELEMDVDMGDNAALQRIERAKVYLARRAGAKELGGF